MGYALQRLSWRRQARLDLHKQRYLEGSQLLEEVSSLADRRYFRLQRLVWAISDNATADKLTEREREYFETVVEWNERLRSIHNRIRLLIGEKEALEFLDYDDEGRDEVKSMHYRFVRAHRIVLRAKEDSTVVSDAREVVDRLNWTVSRMAYDLTTLFMSRATSMALLKPAALDGIATTDGQIPGRWQARHLILTKESGDIGPRE